MATVNLGSWRRSLTQEGCHCLLNVGGGGISLLWHYLSRTSQSRICFFIQIPLDFEFKCPLYVMYIKSIKKVLAAFVQICQLSENCWVLNHLCFYALYNKAGGNRDALSLFNCLTIYMGVKINSKNISFYDL